MPNFERVKGLESLVLQKSQIRVNDGRLTSFRYPNSIAEFHS